VRVGHRLLNIVCSSKDIADVEIKTGSFTAARFQNIHLTRGMNPHIIKVYGTICQLCLRCRECVPLTDSVIGHASTSTTAVSTTFPA